MEGGISLEFPVCNEFFDTAHSGAECYGHGLPRQSSFNRGRHRGRRENARHENQWPPRALTGFNRSNLCEDRQSVPGGWSRPRMDWGRAAGPTDRFALLATLPDGPTAAPAERLGDG